MKKLFIILTALLFVGTISAQPRGTHHHTPKPTPSILIQADRSETFQVYIDGDLVNNVPKSEVLIEKLDTRLHEVVVILTHPAHKAAVTQLYATTPAAEISVSYDMRRQQLLLYSLDGYDTPPLPTPEGHSHWHGQVTPPTHPSLPTHHTLIPHTTTHEPVTVSDQWVDEMVAIIKGQSFDSERLTTAKNLLNNGKPFTASQITRIAQTIEFGSSQVDFLKAAYSHCADPENYERALAVLTFSSDRESVRTFISTLR